MSKNIVWPVLELSTCAKAADYTAVIELDAKLRAQEIPSRLQLTRQEIANPTPGMKAREYVTLLYRPLCEYRFFYTCNLRSSTLGLILIHRSFFVSALITDPHNLFCTPYARSVVTVFCCSSFLIRTFAGCFEQSPEIFIRFWPRWTHLLSAAVILGSLAIRAPFVTPSSALVDLDTAVQLYEKAAPKAPRAQAALVCDDCSPLDASTYLRLTALPPRASSESTLHLFEGDEQTVRGSACSKGRPGCHPTERRTISK
jgi:hypothetical protein